VLQASGDSHDGLQDARTFELESRIAARQPMLFAVLVPLVRNAFKGEVLHEQRMG